MKPLLFGCWGLLLIPCFIVTGQVLHKNHPPDETRNTGGVFLDTASRFPYVINYRQQNRYDNEWTDHTLPIVKLNKGLDTLELTPISTVKVIKIGSGYYKLEHKGSAYDLKLLYRIPVVY